MDNRWKTGWITRLGGYPGDNQAENRADNRQDNLDNKCKRKDASLLKVASF